MKASTKSQSMVLVIHVGAFSSIWHRMEISPDFLIWIFFTFPGKLGGFHCSTSFFGSHHNCSIKMKSGLIAGQSSKCWISSSIRNHSVAYEMVQGTPSGWKMSPCLSSGRRLDYSQRIISLFRFQSSSYHFSFSIAFDATPRLYVSNIKF